MNITLEIEHLILHGFPSGERFRIGDAVETELMRLLREEGIPPALLFGQSMPAIDAGSFNLPSSAKGAAIGQHIARQIYTGLNTAKDQ